ncbi:9784_t:CDS:2, partial [Funneliformis geosporum]
NNTISYKIDESLAIITFIEFEYQKCLSIRYFIEKLYSFIASTGTSLQIIKIDENQEVIGNLIKNADFNAFATSWKLSLKEAEILKFNQKHSIANIIALKHFYILPEAQKHFLWLSYFR